MKSLVQIEQRLEALACGDAVETSAAELLHLGEGVLEHWVSAKNLVPTTDTKEGFRLLALHRQGSADDPSFNACRETCRELIYHFNLISKQAQESVETAPTLKMMVLVANHLCLFVSGKMQSAEMGEFCCSSAPLHQESKEIPEINNA